MEYQHIVDIKQLSLNKAEFSQFLQLSLEVISKERERLSTEKYSINKFAGAVTLRVKSAYCNISKKDILKMQKLID